MPITVELQDMFSYSFLLVALMVGLVVLIGVLALVLFLVKKNAKKSEEAKPAPVAKKVNPVEVKDQYCAKIDDIEKKCRSGKMSNRKAYQKLSAVLRRFVYEVTGVKVHNYTLEEIKRINMPNLWALIDECYAPEFSVDKKGDIYDTMNKARMVIKEWR